MAPTRKLAKFCALTTDGESLVQKERENCILHACEMMKRGDSYESDPVRSDSDNSLSVKKIC